MKTIFQVSDKVFDHLYGWGQVLSVKSMEGAAPITQVAFTSQMDIMYYHHNGALISIPNSNPTLSFTEYTLKGFSQERHETLPEKGDVVWVRDCESEEWTIAYFIEKQDNCYLINLFNPHNEGHEICYKFLTTVNPHKK
jgi:hypothetical protein